MLKEGGSVQEICLETMEITHFIFTFVVCSFTFTVDWPSPFCLQQGFVTKLTRERVTFCLFVTGSMY